VGQGRHCISKGLYFFSIEKEIKFISYEKDFFVHQRRVLAVKRVEFVSDRIPYIVLRCLWLNIIVSLNGHVPTEEKHVFSRDSFYEELQQLFDQFPQYQMKILLDFNAKLRRECIFKPAT